MLAHGLPSPLSLFSFSDSDRSRVVAVLLFGSDGVGLLVESVHIDSHFGQFLLLFMLAFVGLGRKLSRMNHCLQLRAALLPNTQLQIPKR